MVSSSRRLVSARRTGTGRLLNTSPENRSALTRGASERAPFPQPKSSPPCIAIIGAGRMGIALGVELMAQGTELAGYLNRTAKSRRHAAQRLGVSAEADLQSLAGRGPELWLLTVPDASLPGVVDALSPLIEPGQYVAHTSGATSVSVLEPCAAQGAVTLAFHPLQTVTAAPAPELFRGVSVAVTPGAAGAWEAGLRLAELLGARPFLLRDEDRAL
ncbi:MAG TPA: NAD(P)-binding domain-containing protein, partial [Thermoleophilia bacterium]|nr:NAD(P)-binding domain-containing protein [Thermoleophilia bacterium]